ncbi:unnamed protein product [Durusdinium trenchii]|uniref:Transmembrane protein n=1 Tax=Durusdinium trenchii TaxID=1381693 RepID=A0ABP0MPS3_9DINO
MCKAMVSKPGLGPLGISLVVSLFSLVPATSATHDVRKHEQSIISAEANVMRRDVAATEDELRGGTAKVSHAWHASAQTSFPRTSGAPWPNPVHHAVQHVNPDASQGTGAVGQGPAGKDAKGGKAPNDVKEAEAIVEKFFKIEAMVARETGLPLNSSSAAEKEMEEAAKKEEEDEEEEEGRIDLLYASMIVCVILVAGLAYYRWRQGRAQDEVHKPLASGTTK